MTEPSAPFPPYTITREVTAMIVLAMYTCSDNEAANMIGRDIFLAGNNVIRSTFYMLVQQNKLHELKFNLF